MKTGALSICLLCCLAACAKSADEIKRESRRELLAALPGQLIIPGYRDFSDAVAALEAGVAGHCAAGEGYSGLDALRGHWRAAMTAWQRSAAYAYGPVALYDLPALINYPVRRARIDHWLQPGRQATLEDIANYSVQGRGLGAIEYLLFEPEIARDAASYCAYLSALAGDLKGNAEKILRLWRERAAAIADNVESDADAQQDLDELLNSAFQAMETVKDDKLGAPLGHKHEGVIQPGRLESRLSAHSLQNIRANIISLRMLLYGTGDPASNDAQSAPGLASYLNKTGGRDAATALERALSRTLNAIDQISGPLLNALHEQPLSVEALYREVADLCAVLEKIVLPAFDVQPGFNARDGD